MLKYIGRAQGWTLTGVPSRDLSDTDIAERNLVVHELVASGAYLPDDCEDPVAAFNAARALVAPVTRQGVTFDEASGQEVVVDMGAAAPREQHPLHEDASAHAAAVIAAREHREGGAARKEAKHQA